MMMDLQVKISLTDRIQVIFS